MSKFKTKFVCQECGHQTPKWLGKCPDCHSWNSFVEEVNGKSQSLLNEISVGNSKKLAKKICEIETQEYARYQTGISEFDRVMGGGISKSSLTLLGGEPGIGKSTLLMEICGKISNVYMDQKILYVSGEESEGQVASRSQRLEINNSNFYILHETNWQNIIEVIKEIKPRFFILDSIQTTVSSEIQIAAGTVSQIREVTYELMNFSKAHDITCFVIGHVTKEGNIAGPKILEHMVDTVIYFEGDQLGQYRMLRVMKNRFGNTNEVGIFEMNDKGLQEIGNPSQYFIDSFIQDTFGRSLSCILEGTRPIFVEIQALVVENKFGSGKRVTQGLDNNRLSLLVAVIDKYFDTPISFNDIYINVVGGIKLHSRESDLSIITSLLSSFYGSPIQNNTVFIGEVGLTGEVRRVPLMENRLRELEQLNYKKVVTSKKVADEFNDKYELEIIGIEKAVELKSLLFA